MAETKNNIAMITIKDNGGNKEKPVLLVSAGFSADAMRHTHEIFSQYRNKCELPFEYDNARAAIHGEYNVEFPFDQSVVDRAMNTDWVFNFMNKFAPQDQFTFVSDGILLEYIREHFAS